MRHASKLKVLVLIAAVLFSVTGCAAGNKSLEIKTAKAVLGKLETQANLTGALLPAQMVNVAAQANGRIAKVNAAVGSHVSQGEVMLTLEQEQLAAQAKQAEATYENTIAQLRQAEIALESAKRSFEQTKTLYDAGAVSQEQFLQVKSAYDIAESKYNAAAGAGTTPKPLN
jgi:multidrug efflux pump subunit AcrA (membrane-fusion protein)